MPLLDFNSTTSCHIERSMNSNLTKHRLSKNFSILLLSKRQKKIFLNSLFKAPRINTCFFRYLYLNKIIRKPDFLLFVTGKEKLSNMNLLCFLLLLVLCCYKVVFSKKYFIVIQKHVVNFILCWTLFQYENRPQFKQAKKYYK